MATFWARKSRAKRTFMLALARDLRQLGHSVRIQTTSDRVMLTFAPRDFATRTQDEIRRLYLQLRDRHLRTELQFIQEQESNGILELFIKPHEFNLNAITPDVMICTKQREKDVFRYAKHLQSVPASKGVGRQLSAIVYDSGQKRRSLIGVIGLASPTYAQQCRDNVLGWASMASANDRKKTRRAGLCRMMQLTVCEAFPPYTYLDAAKLLALLAFSDPVRQAYEAAKNAPLLALTTTVATGVHSAIFNRV